MPMQSLHHRCLRSLASSVRVTFATGWLTGGGKGSNHIVVID
jgi:hypothetical protein